MSVDFITQLPETAAGHSAIVVFVDRLSKMVRLAPCWNTLGAQECSFVYKGSPETGSQTVSFGNKEVALQMAWPI